MKVKDLDPHERRNSSVMSKPDKNSLVDLCKTSPNKARCVFTVQSLLTTFVVVILAVIQMKLTQLLFMG